VATFAAAMLTHRRTAEPRLKDTFAVAETTEVGAPRTNSLSDRLFTAIV
jgi:hypothetical protein